MAEALLTLAQCKLWGNQRLCLVYDDQTLEVLALRAVGKGQGSISVKARLPKDQPIRNVRLAHKADNFDMLDLRGQGLRMEVGEDGNLACPADLDLAYGWTGP